MGAHQEEGKEEEEGKGKRGAVLYAGKGGVVGGRVAF